MLFILFHHKKTINSLSFIVVGLIAIQAVLIVTFAVAPAAIFSTSAPPLPKLVITSLPVTLNKSIPDPPIKVAQHIMPLNKSQYLP